MEFSALQPDTQGLIKKLNHILMIKETKYSMNIKIYKNVSGFHFYPYECI
jgi:hypothetical protein